MNIRQLTASLLLAAGLAAGAQSIDVDALSKYVYPANQPAAPKSFVYMPDGLSYLLLDSDGTKVRRYDTASGKELETVFDASRTREASVAKITDFVLSPDGGKLLVCGEKQPVYRRSFKAPYYIFEIKRNILRPLGLNGGVQQSPLFSPDGRMVAFVVDNNIHIRKWDYNTEVEVTTDGAQGKIVNGIPDWTYEEEFSTSCSMAWSPDSQTLCYLRYDEAEVPMFSFPLYSGWCEPNSEYALYPGRFSYKYPVAGEKNSVVTLHSYDVETRKVKALPFKDPSIEYIPRIGFGSSPERLIVSTLNRAQNRMELYSVNPKSTVSRSLLVEESKAWLDPSVYEDLVLEDDGIALLSERSGWRHIYVYSYEGQLLRQVTSGNYDVTAYYGRDAQGFRYYQSVPRPSLSTGTPAAANRVVSRVDRQGKKTEDLTPAEGWASATLAPAANFLTVNYSTAATPPVYTLYNAKGKAVRTLEDNAAYAARYASLPAKEFFTMTTSEGVTLNGYMIRPRNAAGKAPVIMWQYSGPGSQEVVNRWRMDWDYYAAAEAGFAVVCVDGRGTGARGTAFRDIVYKRLGHFETIDQLAAARYASSLPFADALRIGIAGWSYGGYETLMAVQATGNPYKAGVAIAPVTSWRYYDTVYAERFMLTPQENERGYEESAPVNYTDKMNCRLLLMSGTADDNVHLSNTMEYVAALQGSHRYADMFLFPNMNHSINGCEARALVYGRMLDFFKQNL